MVVDTTKKVWFTHLKNLLENDGYAVEVVEWKEELLGIKAVAEEKNEESPFQFEFLPITLPYETPGIRIMRTKTPPLEPGDSAMRLVAQKLASAFFGTIYQGVLPDNDQELQDLLENLLIL